MALKTCGCDLNGVKIASFSEKKKKKSKESSSDWGLLPQIFMAFGGWAVPAPHPRLRCIWLHHFIRNLDLRFLKNRIKTLMQYEVDF